MNRTRLARQRSFRDPSGFVFREGNRILRAVAPDALRTLEQFLDSPPARAFLEQQSLVQTWFPPSEDFGQPGGYHLVEHEPVPFPSFPSEWPPEMLAEAGLLTLDLASACLDHGWRLKDATPANVLFRGPSPVFVDLLSFERADPREAIWPAYAQFVRTFLLPLLTGRSVWLTHRDGLPPAEAYRSLSWGKRLTLPGLVLATLPHWITPRAESDGELYKQRPANPEVAAFTLRRTFARLRRQLWSLMRGRRGSEWSRYRETQAHYDAEQVAAKESFVSAAMQDCSPRRVLDIGANTGHFSEIAARSGASVVAIDADSCAVGNLWQRARADSLDILPLVVDFCRPTPAAGWRNEEYPSFLDRARGKFDMVMMLAVAHHLLVTERVPLEAILDLAADLTREFLLIEYVAPEDPMFRRLVRGRDALYAHLTVEHFENVVRGRFRIAGKQPIRGTARTLYLLRKLR